MKTFFLPLPEAVTIRLPSEGNTLRYSNNSSSLNLGAGSNRNININDERYINTYVQNCGMWRVLLVPEWV